MNTLQLFVTYLYNVMMMPGPNVCTMPAFSRKQCNVLCHKDKFHNMFMQFTS